jgi:hypothetical protein
MPHKTGNSGTRRSPESLARPAVNVLFGVRLGVGWLATARIVTVAQFRPGVAECLLVGMLSVLVGMFN